MDGLPWAATAGSAALLSDYVDIFGGWPVGDPLSRALRPRPGRRMSAGATTSPPAAGTGPAAGPRNPQADIDHCCHHHNMLRRDLGLDDRAPRATRKIRHPGNKVEVVHTARDVVPATVRPVATVASPIAAGRPAPGMPDSYRKAEDLFLFSAAGTTGNRNKAGEARRRQRLGPTSRRILVAGSGRILRVKEAVRFGRCLPTGAGTERGLERGARALLATTVAFCATGCPVRLTRYSGRRGHLAHWVPSSHVVARPTGNLETGNQ